MQNDAQKYLEKVTARYLDQPEFIQAVKEFLPTVWSTIKENGFEKDGVFDCLMEPDRIISFRVAWTDDSGSTQVNRGFRVQWSNALGPYKGGLRFHPTVTESVLKFLAFEQVFKNSLTGLWLGGGKGGSDFDPKGKSDGEVMRFCQAFMFELARHIGPNTDVPAGDIGVGGREIGYLFGAYKKHANSWDGTLTGKLPEWGGSLLRPEATGYGVLYFAEALLASQSESLEGKTALISGSGNVAQYACEKALELGMKVLTLSDSSGTIYDPSGITKEKLAFIMHLKNVKRGRIEEYIKKWKDAKYLKGKKPWVIEADIAFPCATQNEIDLADAKLLIKNNVKAIIEGANMPTRLEALHAFQIAGVTVAPSKAANAGGVAVSGLEMAQDSARLPWTRETVDQELKKIMEGIFEKSKKHAGKNFDLVRGANIAGLVRVAEAIREQGI